ncbi:MAG: L-seryl-tRNA(Sec) selenium transferase [Gemmataceae bacterium]|nr:L-seryl-tRNA(Sec) selenium transferase [Gemmataceae bacterium]
MQKQNLRDLPAVHTILNLAALRELTQKHGNKTVSEEIRKVLEVIRDGYANGNQEGHLPSAEQIAGTVAAKMATTFRDNLRKVINATGIVLHTNLGRAPMAEEAARAAYEAARGYLNLEVNLETGKRSSRQDAIRNWACQLLGAEAATAVNNCAAATILVLRALAYGKEVIVSRGQLIEIGGSFRLPEIMGVSGATLKEVGTTNITKLADYEKAITPNTAAILRVHPSNYRISGFSHSVPLADLVALGKRTGIPVIDDVGSGAVFPLGSLGFEEEPNPKESIQLGADLTLFSGDKLLGGPQAGIIAGKKELLQKIEKDPLMRAFRLDKMTLAALEQTLRLHLNPEAAKEKIPTLRMLTMPLEQLEKRARYLQSQLQNIPGIGKVRAIEEKGFAGGGSLPDQEMPAWVVEIESSGDSGPLAQALRTQNPAIFARVQDNKLLLDLRTIQPEEIPQVLSGMQSALGAQVALD